MTEYIEREQILDTLVASDDPWVSYLQPGIVRARAVVNSLPAADVAPVVHGRWVLRHEGRGHYWECSVCHENPCIYVTKNTKFCSNCGAKMDLED